MPLTDVNTPIFVQNLRGKNSLVAAGSNNYGETQDADSASAKKQIMSEGGSATTEEVPFVRFLKNLYGDTESSKYTRDDVRQDLDLDKFEPLDSSFMQDQNYDKIGGYMVTFYKDDGNDKNGNMDDVHTFVVYTPMKESHGWNNDSGKTYLANKLYGGVDGDTQEEVDGQTMIDRLRNYKDAGYKFQISGASEGSDERNSDSSDSEENSQLVPFAVVQQDDEVMTPNLLNLGGALSFTNQYSTRLTRNTPKVKTSLIEGLKKYGNNYLGK